ncbi:MAG TPA: hypothetical protein VK421_06385 [Pyrinomonadaceae bacterium]|nr:hypothetical protein [Pyrinomonadaceae bacterium]
MNTRALSRTAAWAFVCLSLAAASVGQTSSPQQPAKTSPPPVAKDSQPQVAPAAQAKAGWLDLRVNHVLDLFYLARKHAANDSQKIEGIDASPELIAAIREMHREFGGWFTPLWSMIDANLMVCQTADDATRELSDVPETINFRGKSYRMREPALRLARALQAAEPQFLKTIWPAHKTVVEEATARLARTLKPKEQEFLAFFARHLLMDAPRASHPVYLVAEAQYPGAFTNYTRDSILSIVSVKTFPGTLLEENVLHEALHSLDVVAGAGQQGGTGARSIFAELRDRLRKAGVSERDLQDAAHFIVFVTAAEAVRQIIDPAHKHYGDVQNVYTRLPRSAPVVPVWRDYLGGKLTRERALDLMIEKVPRAEPPKPQPTPTPTPPNTR